MASEYIKRVTWRVLRRGSGWVGVVMIGEVPITLPQQETKRAAREFARERANQIKRAGP